MTRRTGSLHRDLQDKKIAGVCAGLARYFDIDTVLVRLAFVILVLVGGGGVLAYIVLWIVMTPAPRGYWDEIEAEPDVVKPVEAGPAEAGPTAAKPVEAEPTEAKPTDPHQA